MLFPAVLVFKVANQSEHFCWPKKYILLTFSCPKEVLDGWKVGLIPLLFPEIDFYVTLGKNFVFGLEAKTAAFGNCFIFFSSRLPVVSSHAQKGTIRKTRVDLIALGRNKHVA